MVAAFTTSRQIVGGFDQSASDCRGSLRVSYHMLYFTRLLSFSCLMAAKAFSAAVSVGAVFAVPAVLISCAALPVDSEAADTVVAYRGAQIETVADAGTIQNGIIVVKDGLIESVGQSISIPASARIVDVTGQTVMPALVDVYHPVTIDTGSTAAEPRVVVFGGRTFTIPSSAPTTAAPFVKLSDNLDPLSLGRPLKTNARYGVGLMNIVSRGYGQSLHVRVSPSMPETSIINPDGALFIAVTNTTASLDVLRNGLKGRAGSSGSRSGRSMGAGRSVSGASSTNSTGTGNSSTGGGAASTSSSSSESQLTTLWQSVKDGKTPLILNVNNAATILYVLEVHKEFNKVQLTIVADGDDIYQTFDQLKDAKASIILRSGLNVAPRSSDRINVPRMLETAGIPFGFSTSLDASLSAMPDTPLFPVSLLVKTGLSRNAALKALTLTPAKVLGVEKIHGSIEAGKKANLLFFDGDPFAPNSRVKQLIVEGDSVYED